MDFEDFRHNKVNLTGFRLIDYNFERTKTILEEMNEYGKRRGPILSNGILKVDVYVFRHLGRRLNRRSLYRVPDYGILRNSATPPPRPRPRARVTTPPSSQVEAALMHDAVHVLAHALRHVDTSSPHLRLVNLSCDSNHAWPFGSSLYNYLNAVRVTPPPRPPRPPRAHRRTPPASSGYTDTPI